MFADNRLVGTAVGLADCPQPAGHYRIGDARAGTFILVYRRPNWLHRTLMRLLLGLTWIDLK